MPKFNLLKGEVTKGAARMVVPAFLINILLEIGIWFIKLLDAFMVIDHKELNLELVEAYLLEAFYILG